jgi:hypothetical protein
LTDAATAVPRAGHKPVRRVCRAQAARVVPKLTGSGRTGKFSKVAPAPIREGLCRCASDF